MTVPPTWEPLVARLPPLTLSPDPGRAREWLRDELSGAAYQQSLLERFQDWLDRLLGDVRSSAGDIGGVGPVVALVLLVVLLLAGAFLLSRLRANPTGRAEPATVFDVRRLSADQHHRLAEEALSSGDWDAAVVEAVRALTARLFERGLLPEQHDVTVHEIVERASALFPDRAERLQLVGGGFDETRYGDRPAHEAGAREAVVLERELASAVPQQPTSRGPVTAVPR